MKRVSRITVALGLGVGLLIVASMVFLSPTYYFWRQERMVRRILRTDPVELRAAARALLRARTNAEANIEPSGRDVPAAIRSLHPTLITVSSSSIAIEFGDAANPFGVIAYLPDATPPPSGRFGKPPVQWIDGLFVYDDGQLEHYGQPSGPTNRR